jgi:threonine synthase
MARKAILESGGFSITVSDDEILNGQRTLAAKTGVFAEPASSAVVAALNKLRGSKRLGRKEQIVLLITGHGLKDVEAAMRGIGLPKAVEPTLAAVEAALAKSKCPSPRPSPRAGGERVAAGRERGASLFASA